MKQNKKSGFTIIELLIVIVIIGILAAITIISFTGVSRRASNTNRIATAKQAVDLINSYIGAKGAYPDATGASMCIGQNFPGGKCWGADSGSPTLESASTPMVTALSSVGVLGAINYSAVDMGYWHGIGPVYHYKATRTVDGASSPVIIIYFLDGANQDCGLPNVIIPTNNPTPGTTENTDVYTRATTIPRYSTTTANGTYCIVAADAL